MRAPVALTEIANRGLERLSPPPQKKTTKSPPSHFLL